MRGKREEGEKEERKEGRREDKFLHSFNHC